MKLSSVAFTEYQILRAISKIKNNSSPGYDGLPPTVFKNLKHVLTFPLLQIFNASITKGELPTAWKNAIIVPIYKKGDKSRACNYRPISLTSIVCKIMERVIYDTMQSYLRTHNLLSDNQHAYTSGKSCLSQLLTFTNNILSQVKNGDQVDVAYLDFSKALIVLSILNCYISSNA